MNILLIIGILLILGYIAGSIFDRLGLPKIIGYIATGILFSPNTISFISPEILNSTQPLMEICLAFIVFEVGGELKWSKLKRHGKEIVSITLFAGIFPFLFVLAGIYILEFFMPSTYNLSMTSIISFALILGAMASPTDPTATIAVMHQYKAKGRISQTIMGVTALDDVLGIFLFSISVGLTSVISGTSQGMIENAIFDSIYQIIGGIAVGLACAASLNFSSKIFKIKSDGQWIVVVLALIILCYGLAALLHVDELFACMTMGMFVANRCKKHELIFRLLERYTEELIFLFFFLLSGLRLNIQTLPHAITFIVIFVILRAIGKFTGANTGIRIANPNKSEPKHIGGGLIPQGGVVIGLVLSVYQNEEYAAFSELLLTTVMGATIINEIIGPFMAKRSLIKLGEIKPQKKEK